MNMLKLGSEAVILRAKEKSANAKIITEKRANAKIITVIASNVQPIQSGSSFSFF